MEKSRREKDRKDLFIERRRSGGGGSGGRVDASEFLIIVTATSHLATGYTMAAVALATAWSPADPPGMRGGAGGRDAGGECGSGQPGERRQVDRWSDGERRSARWRAGRGEMALAWEEREDGEEEEEQV